MKILVVGGSGAIGRCVCELLSQEHDIITAGRSSGDIQVDIEDTLSVKTMYEEAGTVDAVISTTGKTHFGPLAEMTWDHCFIGLNNKLMGQINLVIEGLKHVNDNASFTLTSGVLNHDPVPKSINAAMVNGALDAFAKAAANEMDRGIRINVVSPTVLKESIGIYGPFFKGYEPVSGSRVALAYQKSIEGKQTGQVYKVGY